MILNLDNHGSATACNLVELKNPNSLVWAHFDYSEEDSRECIQSNDMFSELVTDFLLSEQTRPRATAVSDGLIVSLRGVNLNKGADPKDMVSVRVFINDSQIITTARRNLKSVDDIQISLLQGEGPKNSSEFLADLSERLIQNMSETIDDLEDNLSDIEENIIETTNKETRKLVSLIRRKSIILRRHLAPQRDAIAHLYNEKIMWLGKEERLRIREVHDDLLRYVEALDGVRDRAVIIQEELISNLSEILNNRMYVMTLMTVLFLPLGLLTGLFGINVGGMPGAESKNGFYVFVLLLLLLLAGIHFFLKKKKWY